MGLINNWIKGRKKKEQKSGKPKKTFVGLLLDDRSKLRLKAYLNKLNLTNPINPNSAHITVVNTPLQKKKTGGIFQFNKDYKTQVIPKSLGVHKYKGKTVLAMDLDCPACVNLQREIYKKFMNHRYTKYSPHITLSYDYKKKTVPKIDKKLILRTKRLMVSQH